MGRAYHTATLLPDGKVLVTGGMSWYGGAAGTWFNLNVEVYDPAIRRFDQVGWLSSRLMSSTATLLQDGRVLIAGGKDRQGGASGRYLYSAGVFLYQDPEIIIHRLTVGSEAPASGVAIAIDPPDIFGAAAGATAASRHYREDTAVTLAAPLTAANGNAFARWDGCDSTSGPQASRCTVAMDEERVVTAVFAPAAADPLAVTAVSPASGPATGGTSVTITGTGFGASQGTGAVSFGGVAATVNSWADRQIMCTAPAHSAGTVGVTVRDSSGRSVTKSAAL
ncbi:MAG: IPT/TIG domain-containing protein [Thermodesulfobacteriota bacterium]